jgi:hypothetical protein
MKIRARPELLLAAGMLLWALALLATWPLAPSFGDEIGYIGQARLLLDGRLHPLPESPGVWLVTRASTTKFPLLFPLLITPLFAIAPRLVFASGFLAALALALVAARALKAWGRSPLWGLVLLAYPPLVMIARTVMADLLLAAFAVGAWWALRRGRGPLAALMLMLVVAIKANGGFIAIALVAGEALGARHELVRRDRAALVRLGWGAAGLGLGLALTLSLNLVTTGSLWFVYDEAHKHLGHSHFWVGYLRTSAPAHLASLVLLPPLLGAGAWPLWRRRELGPLFVVVGLIGLMCFYFFIDTGRSRLETLVLSPRLILPAAAFLLIGYADLLAGLAARVPRAAGAVAVLLVILPALVCLAVSVRHRAWQEGEAAALAEAERVVAEVGAPELGLMPGAVKAGILHRGRVGLFLPGAHEPAVVLCNTASESYRDPGRAYDCALPGYAERAERAGFHVLARTPPAAPPPP